MSIGIAIVSVIQFHNNH